LIVTGIACVRATVDPVATVSPIGPNTLGAGRGNFAADYWHVSDRVAFATGDPMRNGLLGETPTAWAVSHGVPGGGGFPALEFDNVAWSRIAQTGRFGAETVVGAYTLDPGDELDPLYTFVAAGGNSGPFRSSFHGAVNMQLFRKAPRDRAVEDWAYQVAWLSLRLTDMKHDQVTGMLTNLLWEILHDKKYGAGASQ
jgi:hypothetical protein